MSSELDFVCHHCAERHPGPPMGFDLPAPAHWSPSLADDAVNVLEDEICIIRDQGYFIHALLEIPVIDHPETFLWTVWVSLSEDNFRRAVELWERPGRESEPPCFGWLSSQIPGYPVSTLNLRTSLRTGPVGERPTIDLEPTDHPLAVDQRNGITLARVHAIASTLTHLPHPSPPAPALPMSPLAPFRGTDPRLEMADQPRLREGSSAGRDLG